jgi:pilus assembly protein CpaB
MNLLKPKVIIPIAILFGIFATYAAYVYLEKQKESLKEPAIIFRNVVVAASDLSMGAKLNQQNLKLVEWPEDIIPRGSFSDTTQLIDRVVKIDILQGEAILPSKLAPEGSAGDFASLIPAGMRAVTVSVNVVSGVGGFILPGMRVDVVSTVVTSTDKKETTSRIILENREVLAIDQTFQRDNDNPKTAQSVTLLVTPEESERAILANQEGKLQLILRNSTDDENSVTSGVTLQELGVKKIYTPPKRVYRRRTPKKEEVKKEEVKDDSPPKTKTVEVIRSNVRSEVTFDEKGEGKENKKKN